MAIRSLEQVLAEINSLYEPQIQSLRSQQALIPQSVADEERGLQAKQTSAFDEILGGARRRGAGIAFGGIPLSEQAKYTSTEFLPALARLKQGARQQATTLEDAILGINERRGGMAQNLRQQDVDNDFRERTFAEEKRRADEAMAESRRQAAAARSASAAFSPSMGRGSGGGVGGGNMPDERELAFLDVKDRLGRQNDKDLISDYQATLKSANKGNTRDKIKIQLYQQKRPDLFRTPAMALLPGLRLQSPSFSGAGPGLNFSQGSPVRFR